MTDRIAFAIVGAAAAAIMACLVLLLMAAARAGIVSDCERMGGFRVGDVVVACQVVRK